MHAAYPRSFGNDPYARLSSSAWSIISSYCAWYRCGQERRKQKRGSVRQKNESNHLMRNPLWVWLNYTHAHGARQCESNKFGGSRFLLACAKGGRQEQKTIPFVVGGPFKRPSQCLTLLCAPPLRLLSVRLLSSDPMVKPSRLALFAPSSASLRRSDLPRLRVRSIYDKLSAFWIFSDVVGGDRGCLRNP
jgi:hypothetical protein